MMSKLLWLPFIKQNKAKVTIIIFLGLAVNFCTLLLPLSIGKYFEISFGGGANKTKALHLLGIYLPEGILNFFTFFLMVMVLKFLCSWAYSYFTSLLGESFIELLRRRFLQFHMRETVSQQRSKASLLLPFSNDAKNMQRLLVKGVIGLVIDVLFLTMALYVLFSLQVVLTAAAIGMIIDLYLLHRWFNKVHKPLFARKRKKQASLLNHVSQILDAGTVTAENKEEKLEQKITSLQKTLKSYHARKSLLTALTPFLLYLLMAIIMAIITWGVGKEELLPGDGITYILLLLSLFPTIRNIIRIEHTWVQGSLASVKFLEPLATDSEIDTEKEDGIKGKTTKKLFSLLRFGQNGNYK